MPITKIAIKSARAGFRRAGIEHTVEFTEYPIEQFTEEQLAQIAGEPLLTHLFIDGDEQTDDGKSSLTEIHPSDDEGRSNGANDDAGAAAAAAAPAESNAADSTTAEANAEQSPNGGKSQGKKASKK